MKKLFYLSLIILIAASSCTINLYTTGGYDDVYYSPDEISGTVPTNTNDVDQDKATYEETFDAEFDEESNSSEYYNPDESGEYYDEKFYGLLKEEITDRLRIKIQQYLFM